MVIDPLESVNPFTDSRFAKISIEDMNMAEKQHYSIKRHLGKQKKLVGSGVLSKIREIGPALFPNVAVVPMGSDSYLDSARQRCAPHKLSRFQGS